MDDEKLDAQPNTDQGDDETYNLVFDKLIEEEYFVTASIAYCLYKKTKREWLQEFRQMNHRSPTDEEFKNFADYQTNSQLDLYRSRALQIAKSFAEDALTQAKPKILRQSNREIFWRSVASSFVGSIFFSGLLIVLVLFGVLLGAPIPWKL